MCHGTWPYGCNASWSQLSDGGFCSPNTDGLTNECSYALQGGEQAPEPSGGFCCYGGACPTTAPTTPTSTMGQALAIESRGGPEQCQVTPGGCITDGPGDYGPDEDCTFLVLVDGVVGRVGAFATESAFDYLFINRTGVRQLRPHFWTISQRFSGDCTTPHVVWYALFSTGAYWVLIGACNPTLCPISKFNATSAGLLPRLERAGDGRRGVRGRQNLLAKRLLYRIRRLDTLPDGAYPGADHRRPDRRPDRSADRPHHVGLRER